jgi:hypothetical protein
MPYLGGVRGPELPNDMVGYSLMMRQRAHRIAALVASLLVMQLTVTGKAYACPIHASESSQRHTAADAHAMTHGSAATEHQPTHRTPADDNGTLAHCDFPCAPAACGSGVACSATVAVASGGGLSSAAFATNRVVARTALVPPSLTTAPEPPPPRT